MNPFMELTWQALIFLLDRTDFHEPFLGFGLATRVKDAIIEAANDKIEKSNDDPVMQGVLKQILKERGLE